MKKTDAFEVNDMTIEDETTRPMNDVEGNFFREREKETAMRTAQGGDCSAWILIVSLSMRKQTRMFALYN